MNLFELTLQFKGFPIAKAKEKLVTIQQINEANYSQYLTTAKTTILDFHKTHNSSYKAFLQKHNAVSSSSWEDIPILTKADLQQPIRQRFAKGYSQKNSYVNKTSGSSGHPFYFAKDRFCHALSWAEFIDRYQWYGINFSKDLQARFYGIPLEKKGYYKERLKDALSSRFRFPIFDLSDQKMASFLATFSKKRFTYINGYTSSIVLFAKYLKKKNIVLTTVCPTLHRCIVTSEMLFKEDRVLLEKQLGVPVINEYGASELGLIAFENKEGQFQLNSESLFVEVVDDAGKPLPYGETGRIIITSLYNKAQAMLRYDIGDLGCLCPSSTPKKPILKTLTGRTNDIAQLPSGKKIPGLTFYYVTKSVIEDDGNVKEFVVEQLGPDTFKIWYTADKALTDQEKAHIQKALDTYLEPGLSLFFEKVAVLKRSKRGKLKQFIKDF